MLKLAASVARSNLLRWVGRVPTPSVVIFLITYRCNLRCRMCATVNYPSEGEMDAAAIREVFTALKGLRFVRISGGEPLLRHDLIEVVRHIQEALRPDQVDITTNGTLREALLDLVRDRRGTRLVIHVSLDALGAAHDAIRGDGAFAKTYATLEDLVRVRRDYGFQLEVNHTIEADNLADVARFDDEMRRLGVAVNWLLARDFHPPMPPPTQPGRPDCPIYPPLLGNFDAIELGEALDDIIARRIRGGGLAQRLTRRYYLEGIRNRLARGVRTPDPRCVSLTDHLRLMPNGDVTICRSDLTAVGNAATEGFRAVWFGPRADALRETVRSCRRCWYTCEAIPNGIWSGDLPRWVLTRSWRG